MSPGSSIICSLHYSIHSSGKKKVVEGLIKTLKVGGVDLHLMSIFVDDTYLSLERDSFLAFMQLLRDFELASGSKVSIPKSKLVIIGRFRSPEPCLAGFSFQVLTRAEHCQYLGILVGPKVSPSQAWSFVAERLVRRISAFRARELNFEAKVVALRFLLQNMLSFVISLLRLTGSQIASLVRLLRCICGGRRRMDGQRSLLLPGTFWRLL
ncbi:hypothetical protein R1flu_003012 [Riccia fluitans]|uniref:Reverse transcriptase domain-containing protein n=1 Tax=Riccia fluitans TaxID=41844 RepID=A0ABD1YAT2_9MARC